VTGFGELSIKIFPNSCISVNTSMETKECCRCGETKLVEFFYIDKRRNQINGHCKTCHGKANHKIRERKIASGDVSVRWRNNPMGEKDKETVKNLYSQGLGASKISQKLGFSKPAILRFLNKSNLIDKNRISRKYKFKEESYFDSIDSDEKAYFLGLLWADGCNYRNDAKHKNAYHIVIQLKEEDGYMVKELANKIYGSSEITTYEEKVGKGNNLAKQNQIRLRIPSKHISDTLLSYGMKPRKSLTAGMPENIIWTEETIKGFLRGMLDGDGSIYFNSSSNSYGVSYIGSMKQMEEMNDIIEKITGVKFHFETINKYSEPMACLKIHGNKKSLEFCDWLYKDRSYCLYRKLNKYEEMKKRAASKKDAALKSTAVTD
jgi:hypothetical protein